MFFKKAEILTSHQDEGEHASFPHTTIAKNRTRLQTNFTQNWHKIELSESPITKVLKKPHSSRPVGEEEIQRGMERHGDTEW